MIMMSCKKDKYHKNSEVYILVSVPLWINEDEQPISEVNICTYNAPILKHTTEGTPSLIRLWKSNVYSSHIFSSSSVNP